MNYNDRKFTIFVVSAAVALAFTMCASGLMASDISTGDGLTLRLDDASGRIRAVIVDGRELPLLDGVLGGLAYREWQHVKNPAPKTLAAIDFESPAGWVKTANANWKPTEPQAAEPRTDGGALGSRGYVRVGAVGKFGHGIALSAPVPVQPGAICEISWQGRAPALTDTYILYIRVYDANGRDITEASSPSTGWLYSIYSKTHCLYPITLPQPGVWTRISRKYRAPDGAASLRVSLCLWRGEYVDADCLEIRETPEAVVPLPSKPLTGPLVPLANGNAYSQEIALADQALEFDLTYRPAADHIQIEGAVQDTSTPLKDRALQISYALPIRADGWCWHDDIRSRRLIGKSASYENSTRELGHALSKYPFSCITSDAAGLALGVPMDRPLMEYRAYKPAEGFLSSADLGLSPHTAKTALGRATFSLVLYKTDPAWGFRSAAEKYYRQFPDLFTKRAAREGCWLWPISPDKIPNPQDFGLTFWESSPKKQEPPDAAHANGIYILSYIEPCGLRQWFPELGAGSKMYTCQECMAKLKALALDTKSPKTWANGPQPEVAQAVLNSLPETADGDAPFEADKQYDVWAQWWYLNPSPYLAAPSRASTCWKYEVEPVLARADGLYFDSVSLSTVRWENFRQAHIASSLTPLTMSLDTARPCQEGAFAYYEFLSWVSNTLHEQRKLVMCNMGPEAYRLYAHLTDVLGSEVGYDRPLTEIEPDSDCCLRRTFAYHKPTTNLLQKGNWFKPAPVVTRNEIEQYIKHQMSFGFYPAVCTIGGEEKPGYAHWERYFGSPEQFERDRDLFKKYIPIIRRINDAGWEPVTYARIAGDEGVSPIHIERFGDWRYNNLYFTIRNTAKETKKATVTVELAKLGAPQQDFKTIAATELLSGRNVPLKADSAAGLVQLDLDLDAFDTTVLSMTK